MRVKFFNYLKGILLVLLFTYGTATACLLLFPSVVLLPIRVERTRVDWMYVGWSYVTLFGAASTFKIILKNGLKSVPLYGWGMQALQFIFLTRERAKDLPHIIQSVRYILYASAKASPVSVPVDIGIPPMSILIFPEGTDLHEKAIAQSNEFLLQQWRKQNPSAQPKDGMEDSNSVAPPSRKHTLCPKVAGATAIIKTCLDYYALSQLKFDSLLDANVDARRNHILLHDVTVAYRDFTPGVRTSDISLVKGEFPPEVHIHIQPIRITSQSLPPATDAQTIHLPRNEVKLCNNTAGKEFDAQVEKIIHDAFLFKEKLLDEFYNIHTPRVLCNANRMTLHESLMSTLSSNEKKIEPTIEWPKHSIQSDLYLIPMWISMILYGCVLSPIVFYGVYITGLLLFNSGFSIYALVSVCYMTVTLFGGVDNFELDTHYDNTIKIESPSDK